GSLSFRGSCIVPPCQSLLHPVPPPAAAGVLSAVAADGSCPNSEVRQPREDVPADPQSANACRHGNLLSSSQHLHHWGSFGAAEPFLSRLEPATLVHADNLKAVGHSESNEGSPRPRRERPRHRCAFPQYLAPSFYKRPAH